MSLLPTHLFPSPFIPMPGRSSIAAYLSNFLLSSFKKRWGCFIFRLPLDIHIDHIFIHLHVEDIMRLRRVNKALFLLTHEPIIWKRFLERMNIPIPPLRPTFRYSLQATDFEVEQLVTRAISLDDNWRKIYPDICRREITEAHHTVLDLKLLPGGKYLVASVKDAASYRYYITIFLLDHPKGHKALARVPTFAKAYHLQAKYMKVDDKPVIMIAYIRRTFKNGAPCEINPSEFSYRTNIDTPHPFFYECICLRIPLDSLELLSNPQITPGSKEFISLAEKQQPPFFLVSHVESDIYTDCLTLFEYNGMPYAAFVKQPDRIVIIDLTSKVISTTVCARPEQFEDKPCHINAIRVLPGQRDILVIRTVQSDKSQAEERDTYLLEIYDISNEGDGEIEPKDRIIIDQERLVSFHISDYGIPSTGNDHPKLCNASGPPPPISIFCRTIDPIGMLHYTVWPTHVKIPATTKEPAKTTYYYSLHYVCFQSRHISSPHVMHVLPGAYRALMYTVMPDDRTDTPGLVRLRRYINPEMKPFDYPLLETATEEPISEKMRPLVPFNIYSSFGVPRSMKREINEKGGISAISWDEGVGRVCIASRDERTIRILDFAHMVQPDARFAAWKKSQEYIESHLRDS